MEGLKDNNRNLPSPSLVRRGFYRESVKGYVGTRNDKRLVVRCKMKRFMKYYREKKGITLVLIALMLAVLLFFLP